MVVGVLEITLGIPGAFSLKEKRSVVRKVVNRLQNNFKASVAEVEQNETFNRAVIGVSVVSNDAGVANSVLDKVLDATERIGAGMADVLDTRLELIHF
ncbi:MAG: DUF503 domain-containing protein [Myxococcota bacterium]